MKKNNRLEKCTFLYDGNWGDSALLEHEKHHKLLEDKNYFWMGFDTSFPFGKFSGRDGKRL